jgi:Carboxypeptidase regulatory-like domain/TonB dependent receptor
MLHRMNRPFVLFCSLTLGVFFAISAQAPAQTFRGNITGTVTDPSGAALPGAHVEAVETATGMSYKAASSTAGEFAFSNLPVGDYSITATAAGFSTVKFNKIIVLAGQSYTLPVKLGMAKTQQTVEVTDDELTVDTVTDVQSSDIPEVAVQSLPNSGRDFLGLDTASTVGGAPHLVIGTTADSGGLNSSGAGFDPIGVTPPLGRTDIAGHLNEDLTWTKGAHQLHFGGEYRKAQVHEFYLLGARGNIFFDGTQGPWSTISSPCATLGNGTAPLSASITANLDPNLLYLADFLAGCDDPSATNITQGDPRRLVYVNSFAYYGQDTWQATKKLSLNYGLRFDYEGPVHTGQPNLSVFDPSLASGLAVTTNNVANLYSRFWGGYSPRVGFSYQLGNSTRTVLRGGYGLYYDSIYMKSILEDENLQTGADFGPELNPAGSQQVATASALSVVIANNVPFFETYQQALAGAGVTTISTFAKNFRPAYTQTYDLNLEQQIGPSMMWQMGYVGTKGTHLLGVFDINQGALNSLNVPVPVSGIVPSGYNMPNTTCPAAYSGAAPGVPGNDLQCSRPYFSQFPNFGSINEENTNLGSIYNSLQTSLRLQSWHRLAGSAAYTWDTLSTMRPGPCPTCRRTLSMKLPNAATRTSMSAKRSPVTSTTAFRPFLAKIGSLRAGN